MIRTFLAALVALFLTLPAVAQNWQQGWVYPAQAPLEQKIQFCKAFGQAHQNWSPRQSYICQGKCAQLNQNILDEWNNIINTEISALANVREGLEQAVLTANLPQARQMEATINQIAQQFRQRNGQLMQVVSQPQMRPIIQPEVGISLNCMWDYFTVLDGQISQLRRQIPR